MFSVFSYTFELWKAWKIKSFENKGTYSIDIGARSSIEIGTECLDTALDLSFELVCKEYWFVGIGIHISDSKGLSDVDWSRVLVRGSNSS